MVVVVLVSNSSSKSGGYSYDLFAITYDLFAIPYHLFAISFDLLVSTKILVSYCLILILVIT